MLTRDGPKVIEFNARFGDPEAMNVLSLMESNFLDTCEAMAGGGLGGSRSSFSNLATVCKYVVPVGYGVSSKVGSEIAVDEKAVEAEGARLYYAAVNEKEPGKVLTTTSRALGVVGVAGDIGAAEERCENALAHLRGEFFVRHDIGRPEALRKKAEHMKRVRGA